MRAQLLMFCYGVFIIGTFLGLAVSGNWFTTGNIDIINTITMVQGIQVQALGGLNFLAPLIQFFQGMLLMISWNYPFLNNAWGFVFKAIFLYPISFGVIYGFIQLFVTVAQGAAGLVRSLLP